MSKIILLFLLYGSFGWLVEVIFTGLFSLVKKDYSLKSVTYLWMFPIYGLGGLFLHATKTFLFDFISYWILIIYVLEIYILEYSSGYFLEKLLGKCPWKYAPSYFSIKGFIRLDYAPFWFLLALLFDLVIPTINKLIILVSNEI